MIFKEFGQGIACVVISFFITVSAFGEAPLDFREGDIIFQTSRSSQSLAIQLATHSPYSHMGILFKENHRWMVYEAVQPVKKTPLIEWIRRGDHEKYVVKRLVKSEQVLTRLGLAKLRHVTQSFLGRPYDLGFSWSDEKIYCSELVWKAYEHALGIEIGSLKKLSDFDLTHPKVVKLLKERYGEKLPYDESVISPADIFNSSLLATIISEGKD